MVVFQDLKCMGNLLRNLLKETNYEKELKGMTIVLLNLVAYQKSNLF